MKKQRKSGVFVLALIDSVGEDGCKRLLFDLVRGPICRYCGNSIPDRHLKRLYEGKEVYCGACDKRFYGTSGTIIAGTKLSFRQVLKILVMCDLNFKTKEIAKAVNVGTHTIPRWRRKLYEFENR